ncbi:MAG: hypothetical protein KF809_02795 [Chloroflexi bacterium]|nr:hypothetical protein [Chloroflexota bacterium]
MTRRKSPTPKVEPQAAGQPAISIEVLRDRWRGLFDEDGTATSERVGAAERRYCDFVESIADIIGRLTRDGSDDVSQGGITDEVYGLIRETIITRVHERGLAR